jgi:hypothetical protein
MFGYLFARRASMYFELSFVAAQPRSLVHQRESYSFRRGLVHKKVASIRHCIGIIGDDLDAFGLGLAQSGRDAFPIFTGHSDGVHPESDPILNDLVLFCGIGIGGAVEDQIHPEFLRSLVCAFLAGNEIGVPFGLGHQCDGDFAAASVAAAAGFGFAATAYNSQAGQQ